MSLLSGENNAIICRYDDEKLVIEPWGKNSLRVRCVRTGGIKETGYALLPQEEQETPQITVEENKAVIRNGKITAVMDTANWRGRCNVSFYNEKGRELLSELSDNGALELKDRYFRPLASGDYELTVTFKGDPAEKIFGMGQYQQEILDWNGATLELAHRNSQASVPFLLSSKGYGFLWHNPAVGRATFGKNQVQWTARCTDQMDYWITAGDTPAEIESQYMDVVGHAPVMPEYGLGFWQCKLRYWNQEQLLNVAREYHRRGLPVDVIVCDFFHWPRMGDYRFEEEFFPDPKAMVEELNAMGMHLMVSIWPQVSYYSENYREMRENGYLIHADHGQDVAMNFAGEFVTFFDSTNPEARRYLWEKVKKNYFSYGVDVFWLDEAEPEITGYDYDNYRYYAGPANKVSNLYPQTYVRTFFDGMKKEGKEDIINLARCAWLGSARYGALVWSGDIHSDWKTLRTQVCAGLSMGIAGVPWWTTDIGGFSGGDPKDPAFQKLLVRWFEWGTFCPVMRLHGDRVPSEAVYRKDGTRALNTGSDNEIWSYGEENAKILSKYIRFREAMRPYTRQLMEEVSREGCPAIRPMFYEFPQEEICWDLKDQFFFGGDLLVAPVVFEDAQERQVYLPAGASWTLLTDGQVYEGGRWVSVNAPIDKIPVFAKNGSHPELLGLL